MLGRACLGALVVLALLASLAVCPLAAPVVEIRSYAKLELDSVRRADGELVVVGRLYDPVTAQGLADNTVELTIGGTTLTASTDAAGRFTARVPATLAPGASVSVEAAFPGSSSLDAANLHEEVNPTLAPVELELQARPTPQGLELEIHAQSDGEPFLAPLKVFADRVGSEEMKAVGETVAGTPLGLTRKQLGGAGVRRLRVEFAGDAQHQPASATGTYELTASSTTTLSLSNKEVAFEDTLTASGKVVDEDGVAVAGASVTLTAGERRIAQGVTDRAGAYRFRVEGEILGVGQRTLQTLAEPGGSVQTSRSAPTQVVVTPPQPVPVVYTMLAFLATGLAAGAFFAARSKPWLRFRSRSSPAQQHEPPAEPQRGGLVVARPSLVSTLRRASDSGFAGVVRDTVRGRPIAGATVVVRRAEAPHQERATETDEDGAFAIEELGGGEWVAVVGAVSHLSERFAVTVPHRGELRGVRVDLVPVREKVFLLYQRAAQPVLPDPKLWGVWSPRQIVDHVRATRPSPALTVLTDFVEEVYFSARPTEESTLPLARQRVEAAIAERERGPLRA